MIKVTTLDEALSKAHVISDYPDTGCSKALGSAPTRSPVSTWRIYPLPGRCALFNPGVNSTGDIFDMDVLDVAKLVFNPRCGELTIASVPNFRLREVATLITMRASQ